MTMMKGGIGFVHYFISLGFDAALPWTWIVLIPCCSEYRDVLFPWCLKVVLCCTWGSL